MNTLDRVGAWIRTIALICIAIWTLGLLIQGSTRSDPKVKSNCIDLTYRQFRQGSRVVAVVEDPSCEYGG